MSKFTIRKKLIVASAVVCAMFVVLGGVLVFRMKHVDEAFDSVLAINTMVNKCHELRVATAEADQKVASYIGSKGGTPLGVNPSPTDCVVGKWFYGDERKQMESLHPELTTVLAGFEAPHNGWHAGVRTIDALVKKGADQEQVMTLFTEEVMPQSRDVLGMLEKYAAKLQEETELVSKDAEQTSHHGIRDGVVILSLCSGFVLLFGFIFAGKFSRPLNEITVAAQRIAEGNTQVAIAHESDDELGLLANSFRAMATTLVGKEKVIEQISMGDLKVEVPLAGERDGLGHAMANLRNTLESLTSLIRSLVEAARDGRLSTRGEADQYQGGYREIVAGLNDTLDAVLRPIQEATTVLERVGSKDLTARVTGDYRGDHARIKEAVNHAVETLDKNLEQVSLGAEQVAGAAQQIGTGSQSLAQGTSEQASSLEEVSSSMQEMNAMTRQNAANAKEARGIAEATKDSAERGVDSMRRLSSAMDLIKTSSDDTAKIIKTIDEIAFQTNLLALNAAVEAARAGEAGKGFAVVAEEVRNLAMRSAEAAKNTANMIEGSVKNAENGVAINQEVLKNLEEINQNTKRVTEVMAEIAAASDQQSQGIGQVNTAMEQMNQLTQSNAANSEESTSAAEELSAQAEEMRVMVAGFKITNATRSARSTPPPVVARPPKIPIKKAGRDPLPLGSSNGHDAFKDF